MLLIYTHQVTNRIRYTFNVIFKYVLGIDYELTTSTDSFKQLEGAKISYTHTPIGNELFFESGDLLFETGTSPLTPLLGERGIEHLKDIFVLSFFLLTRYEEYIPFTGDKYGRFSAKQSFAYKNNLLEKPVVNIWAKEIKEMISGRYPNFQFPEKNIPTHQPLILTMHTPILEKVFIEP